jgi:hypothetical protein
MARLQNDICVIKVWMDILSFILWAFVPIVESHHLLKALYAIVPITATERRRASG